MIILDALLLLLLVPFALNGWRRGLCREGFDLVGVVGGLVVAAAVAPAGTAFLARQGVPPIAALPIALSAALIATMLVARVVGGIVAQAVHAVYLGPLDRGAGVFFGAVKGAACLGLVLMLLDRFAATPAVQMAIQGSVLGPQLMRVALSALEIGRQVSSGAGGDMKAATMGGRIPAEAIQHIRERASLVEVVSDVVTLRKRGRTVVGLCPFHTEKTPSFTVSEERGFYHCFGCGEHGDVFGFVMKTQSLAFPEAIRTVAQRFGLPVPEGSDAERRGGDPLLAVNAAAATFFTRSLAGPGGARARAYLAERGVGDDVAARFNLGYAPGTGEALARHLRAEGHPIEHALTLGLVARRDSGGVYDRFRDRLVFPIADATGRVVGFGGRVLPGRPSSGDPPPKYLNSSESPLFHKGHTLYGLPQAREAIRRRGRAIVVEGYLDVIALAEAGIEEVVAPLGTALTADQLRVLRRLSESVVSCFDGDDAGRRAAARSFATFVEAGLWGRGVFLPATEDPDTFVRRNGREALEALLGAAEPLVDAFLADLAGPRRDAVGRSVEAAKEVARILKRVRSPLEFEVLVHLAAERLRVREELLRGEGLAASPEAPSTAAPDRAPGPEERLVEIMAMDDALVPRVVSEQVIAEFDHPTWRSAAQALAAAQGHDERAEVVQGLPRATQDRIARRLIADASEMNHEAEAIGCIAQIQARSTDRELKRLQEAMRSAEARGDEATADEARRRFWALKTQSTEKARGQRSPS